MEGARHEGDGMDVTAGGGTGVLVCIGLTRANPVRYAYKSNSKVFKEELVIFVDIEVHYLFCSIASILAFRCRNEDI